MEIFQGYDELSHLHKFLGRKEDYHTTSLQEEDEIAFTHKKKKKKFLYLWYLCHRPKHLIHFFENFTYA